MRLLLDMNLSPRWVDALNAAGHEAVHWSTLGAHDARDEHVMQRAMADDYVIVTNDLDFGSILAARRWGRPSVVQIRATDLRPEAIASLLLLALERASAELASGALVTLDAENLRMRLLPLEQAEAPKAGERK